MPIFKASRLVAAPPDIAYAVASDVASYKDFLPLLTRSSIKGAKSMTANSERFQAELAVTYAKLGLSESFVSEVECRPQDRTVRAVSKDGPFRSLDVLWTVLARDGASDVVIVIDYAFRNPLLQIAAAGVMDYAVQKVMAAFEARAKTLVSGSVIVA